MKMYVYYRFFLIVFLSAPLLVFGQPNGNKFTTFANFKLGTTNLHKIENELGSTPLVEGGDDGDSSLCYKTNLGWVRFLSNDMGGTDRDLLGFNISRAHHKDCAAYPAASSPKALEISGIRFGLTKVEFETTLGTMVQWKGNIGNAVFKSKNPLTKNELLKFTDEQQVNIEKGISPNYQDVTISIQGTFKKGKLIEFEVWRIESYN